MLRSLPAAALACLLLALPAPAQQGRADRLALEGRVVEVADRTPVAGAAVEVPRLGIRVTTDAAGAFRLPAIPAGTHRFQVSRIGYVTNRQTIELAPGDSLVIIPVMAKPVMLEGLAVSAERLARRREQSGLAVFALTREQILGSATLNAAEMALHRAGVQTFPCEGRPGICHYLVRGQPVSSIQLFIDDKVAPGGIPELETYSAAELYLMEFFPGSMGGLRGPMLRVYTVWYVEELAKRGGRLPPIVY